MQQLVDFMRRLILQPTLSHFPKIAQLSWLGMCLLGGAPYAFGQASADKPLESPPVVLASAQESANVQKVVKTLITAITMHKDDLAMKQINTQLMAERLLAETWNTLNAQQQREIAEGLATLLKRLSMPRGREILGDRIASGKQQKKQGSIDTITYEPARKDGDKFTCRSIVVGFGRSTPIDWIIEQSANGLKITDTMMLGESTVESIRADSIVPLLKQGGVTAIIEALHKKLKETAK